MMGSKQNIHTIITSLIFIFILSAGIKANEVFEASPVQDTSTTMQNSAEINPPPGFIRVPANPEMGTEKDFYVSKYEMKIVGRGDGDVEYGDISFIPESRPSGTPWKNLNQDQAREQCKSLGSKYALISNSEWMTIARNIESVPANWSDNQIHPSGRTRATLNIGHSCRKGRMGRDCRMDKTAYSGEALPASTDDTDGLHGIEQGDYETEAPELNENGWNLYRRTHYLSNGEVIWDFSGNVWSWVDWTVPRARDRAWEGDINNEWMEVNNAKSKSARMEEKDYQSTNTEMRGRLNPNGLGRYHPTASDDAGAAMRGGNYMHGSYNNGIYALGMGYGPDTDHLQCQVGFRCTWHPDW